MYVRSTTMESQKLSTFLDAFLLLTPLQRKALIENAPARQIRTLAQLIRICQQDKPQGIFWKKRHLIKKLNKCQGNARIIKDYLLENVGTVEKFVRAIHSSYSSEDKRFSVLAEKFFHSNKRSLSSSQQAKCINQKIQTTMEASDKNQLQQHQEDNG